MAGAHLIFNVTTGIIAIALIFPLARLVDNFSSILEISNTNYTLKLALFHTIFNVIGVIVMIPFIKRLERLLLRLIKDKGDKEIDEPKYLNPAVLKFPGAVISALLNESKYLFKNSVFEIVQMLKIYIIVSLKLFMVKL